MAPRMKHWIGIVAAGMALVAAWRLPPPSSAPREVEVTTAREIRHQRLSDEYRWTSEALRRVRWSDSLSLLTVERAVEGLTVVAPAESALDATLLSRLTETMRGQLDALGGRSSDMVFGLAYQPYDHDQNGDDLVSRRDRTETYLGSRGGVDYCMRVRVHHPEQLARQVARVSGSPEQLLPPSEAFGPCRFYLRYGAAGDRIQEWLQKGGLGFAIKRGARPAHMVEASERLSFRRHSVFGFRVAAFNRPIETDQCLSGLPKACAALFVDPLLSDGVAAREQELVKRSPAASIGGSLLQAYTWYDDPYLLSDLESELGSEAFARFWTSELAVADAFEEAFGVDVGSWLITWIEAVTPIEKPGPGLPRSASSESMLAVGLLVGLAFMRNRRRKLA